MCSTCEALQHEFAEDIIRRRLGLTSGEAQIALTMYRIGMYRSEYAGERGDVLVSRLRGKLGAESINTLRSQGYELSKSGWEKINDALHQKPQSMVA